MQRVSIVIPTYNRARYVVQTVDSVVAQTFGDWHLIIVDDGSTDETPRRLEPYTRDARISLLRKQNRGQATARNIGLHHARGELLCFLDSDDVWKPDKLARQVRLMDEHPQYDVVYGDRETIDADGRLLHRDNMQRHSGRITRKLLSDNFISFSTAMIRADRLRAIGGFDTDVRYGDDYDMWLRLSVDARFLYVPEIFAAYRSMDEQISSNQEARFESNRQTLQRFFDNHPGFATPEVVAETWCRFHIRRGRHRMAQAGHRAALPDLVRALRVEPRSRAAWRALAKWALTLPLPRNPSPQARCAGQARTGAT
jgi:glycosyltransferase involved in cell wall biosynthesis